MNYFQHKDTRFILGEPTNRGGIFKDADFLGTGLPLVGALKFGETFNKWLHRKIRREVKNEM